MHMPLSHPIVTLMTVPLTCGAFLQFVELLSPEQERERQMETERLAKLEARERMLEERKNLPMYRFRDGPEGLMAAIAEHQILIVVAETGSGKTTQVTTQAQTDASEHVCIANIASAACLQTHNICMSSSVTPP